MKNKGVTFLLGDESSQMTNQLALGFASGFQALGLSTRCIFSSSVKSIEDLELEIHANNTTLFISLSGIGMDMRPDKNVFHKLNTSLFLMLLDHPLHYWDKVEVPLGLDAISTLSEADKNFIGNYSKKERKVFKLIHASNPKTIEPWENKDLGLIYFGTLRDSPTVQRNSWLKYGRVIQDRLNAILEEHLSKNSVSLIDAITHVLAKKIDCTQPMLLHPYYVLLDLYLRDYHRVETLKTITSVPLIIGGGGWDVVLPEFNGTNIQYLGHIHPKDVPRYYARAKVVLNIINTYHESHERVFSAMADGSVALTSSSNLYRTTFNAEEIVLFNWQEHNLNDNCRTLLADDKRLKNIAINGHQKFLKQHTWRHRAEYVAKELNLF